MKHPFLIKDGGKLAVLRPNDPQMALRILRDVQLIEDPEAQAVAFQEMLASQPYTFVGLASSVTKGGAARLLDEDGWAVGTVRPGDSFAPYGDIIAHSNAVAEAIASGDTSMLITDPEQKEGPGVFKYEVQADGTLGPVREKA